MAIFCCKDCVPPKRCLHCHSTCEDYIREKAEHDKINAKIAANRHARMDIDEYKIKGAMKMKRKLDRKKHGSYSSYK